MSGIASPLRFPNPEDYTGQYPEDPPFYMESFKEDYESCLIELGLIIENTHDPVLRKKLDDLMRGVPEWLT